MNNNLKMQIDLSNSIAVKETAMLLHNMLDFGVLQCKFALHISNGNVIEASEYLANGNWMSGKSISWNWNSLNKKCTELVTLTGKPEHQCMQILKNCNGNIDLAIRKLSGLPALPY